MKRALHSRRGFTLIELLVALTGGLFVSIAVFALARDATRFYQREGRLASATLAAVTGFDRLRADIARAGFLGTPNIRFDPLVCSRQGSGNQMMSNIASINVEPGGSPNTDALTSNGRDPDALVLTGAYTSVDTFPVRDVLLAGGTGYVVTLQINTGAMARLGWAGAGTQTARTDLLQTVFVPGRALRYVDKEGRQHYGLIKAAAADSTGLPQITLDETQALEERTTARLCGLQEGYAVGGTANVINFIRYEVGSLAGTSYDPLFAASASNASSQLMETGRTELVRRELTGNAANRVTTLNVNTVPQIELAAEYAVDLRFEVTVIEANPTLSNPKLKHIGRTSGEAADFLTYVGVPSGPSTNLPQRVRALRARLSVRSREADRERATSKDSATRLYRFGLGVGGAAGGPFARVRTLQADIMLNNNVNATAW